MTTKKLIWIELIKAFALVWIFINHTSEQLFGYLKIVSPAISTFGFDKKVG